MDNAPENSDAAPPAATVPLLAVSRASCLMNSSTLRLALSKVAATSAVPEAPALLESKTYAQELTPAAMTTTWLRWFSSSSEFTKWMRWEKKSAKGRAAPAQKKGLVSTTTTTRLTSSA